MRKPAGILAVILFTLALSLFAARAASTTTRIDLLVSADTARPGDTVTVGIRLRLKPGWHTYWRNPGDAGSEVKADWTLPPGVTAGDLQWPTPDKLVEPPLTGYVYSNELTLLVPLKIAADAAPGAFEIKAQIKWQECEKECLLGQTEVTTKLGIGPESQTSDSAPLLEIARTKLPKSDSGLVVNAHWENDDPTRPLVIEWSSTNTSEQEDFFPYKLKGFAVKGETEKISGATGKIQIRKLVEKLDEKSTDSWPAKIDGLIVSRSSRRNPWLGREVSLAVPALVAQVSPPPAGSQSLALMLGFAFLGGLILNIMPCVLPVIALKVLSFVNQAKETPARVRKLGLVYGAGVLVSFLVLALVAIGVQQAGGLASWSSPFQNPQFRLLITVLITLVALNLFGVFEVTLSSRAMGAADQLAGKDGMGGAFFNGMLATLLATPCTAPFLAPAVGFAFTQAPLAIVLIFLMAGAGLAAPFVLLCWQPAWLSFLPKPGLWMLRFKVAVGFPMLATAIWLFWVTAPRLGKSGVLWLGIFLVTVALAAWIWGEFVQRSTKRRGLAMLVSLLFVAGAYGFILEKQLHWRSPVTAQKDALVWETWSAEAVAKARGEGHPVLVDFTADTCLNCQVNKLTSIDVKTTRAKLREMNAVTLVADFTDEDPVIAKELKKYGRAGVPLVLIYPADKSLPPIVLPDGLLTPGQVHEALDKAKSTAPLVSAKVGF